MTFILTLIFWLLFSLLIINNLIPNFSIKYRRLYIWPTFLFTILTYSLLVSQIISGNPKFSASTSFDWLQLGSMSLAITFLINNSTLILGAMLATLFLVQIIGLYTHQTSKNQSKSWDNAVKHQVNCIFTLVMAGLLVLLADSLLILFFGMALISGIVIYRNLLINGGKTSINNLIWFLIADSIYLIAVLYTYTLFHTVSISEIATIANANIQGSPFSIVGFLLVLPIIIKLIKMPFSEQTNNSNPFVHQSIFSINAISIIMILLVRFMDILYGPCLVFILITGIVIALFSAFSSILKNSSEPAYKSLLIAQTGIFLIIIGSHTFPNALLFVVSFTFTNLLLIISQKTSQQVQLVTVSRNSMYKSGNVWIFLFAAFGISGLLPGSGFIPRNVLIQQYLSFVSDNPLYWVILVFTSLCLLLISFASFRYFFNHLYRWKSQNISGSRPQFFSNVLLGILVLLNLYPVFSLPHFNPMTSDNWIFRMIGGSKILSNVIDSQFYIALWIIAGIPLIGFFLALLTYHFQVIKSSSIHSVLKPVKQIQSISKTLSTNIIHSISRLFTRLSAVFISIEGTAIQKSLIKLSTYINSIAVGFALLNRKITSRKSSTTILNRISDSLLVSWEKHDLLIPFLLVIIVIIILVLSII